MLINFEKLKQWLRKINRTIEFLIQKSISGSKNGCGLDRLERHYSSPKITLHLTIMAFFVVSQSVWLAYIDKYTTAFVLLSTLHILVTSIPVSQKNIHINICSILVQFCGRKFFSQSTSHFFPRKPALFSENQTKRKVSSRNL